MTNRFANLTLNNNPEPEAPEAPAPVEVAPEPKPKTATSSNPMPGLWAGQQASKRDGLVPGEDIVPAAKALADEEQQLASDILGIAIEEQNQWYVNGTKMLDCGEDVAMHLRKNYEDLPAVFEALEGGVDLIEAENRKDYLVPLKNLLVDPKGAVTGINGRVVVGDTAMSHLAQFAPKEIGGRQRFNLNLWVPESNKTVKFRTRNPDKNGTRAAYAVVSEKYSKFDLDDVCKNLMQGGHIPRDAHAQIKYDGGRWSISIELAPTFKVDELGVGRVFRVVMLITSGDDKSAGLRVSFQVKRIACINCTTMTDSKFVFTKKHIGDLEGMFTEMTATEGQVMESFAAMWRDANKQSIIDKVDGGVLTADEVFRRLIVQGHVNVAGYGGKKGALKLHAKLMAAFEAEPGNNAAAIVNAITRMAHSEVADWKSPWAVDELEQQAGNILHNRLYALKPLSKEKAEMFVQS